MGEARFNQRRTSWTSRKWVLLLCMGLLLFGCVHMPSPEEMEADREANARQDVEAIKPAMEYGNFGETPMTLEDCIRFALDNNLEMRIARLNEEIADKESLVAKLQMLPSLSADATYKRRDVLRKSDAYNWLLDEDQPDFTVSELKDNTRANLTLTWNILDTMMAYVRGNASEMQEEVIRRERARQAQQLALDVTRAYWHAAAVEDALDYVHVVETNLKEVKRNMDQAVERGSYDSMAASDAELRLKELELTIRQLQANLSRERLQLAQLMGLNQNVQFTLARPPIKPIVANLPHTKELNIDRLEEYALLHRPELFASDMQVRIQKEEAKNKVLAMFPGLSIFAGAHYEDNRLLLQNNWATVGAGIGWELLDLPAKYVSYKGQQKAIQMAEAQRLMSTVGVITQVHIALLDYAIKVDRFRLLDETYALANNLFDMAQTKNQAGRLPELAVTQRHLEEMAAKLRRDEAVVDMLVAHKRLCVSIGMDPLECDQQGMLAAAGGAGGGEGQELNYTATTGMNKWRCTECGYIHTGAEPPEICPICGVGSEYFVEVTNGGETGAITASTGDESDGISGTGVIEDADLDTWGVTPPVSTSNEAMSRSGGGAPGYAGPAADRFLWQVQMGAFSEPTGPTKRMNEVEALNLRMLDSRDTSITTARVQGNLLNRVRVRGLTQAEAQELARELRDRGVDYWLIAPDSVHW
ncbi:MAG: TolC family protein [Desulfococcaceae bacterium]